jgi:coenzyme F420-reducing hydrogenase delta subunit
MCHYVEGNRYAKQRVKTLRKMLKESGFDPRRLSLHWFKPDDAQGFVEAVTEFTEEIEHLGPSHLHSGSVEAWDAPLITASLLSPAIVAGKS